MRPIIASLSAFALLGFVSAADAGTSSHYDISRQEMRSARGSITSVADHPAESKTALRVIVRDFMVVHLGQREFLASGNQGTNEGLDQPAVFVGTHDVLRSSQEFIALQQSERRYAFHEAQIFLMASSQPAEHAIVGLHAPTRAVLDPNQR